MGDAIDDELFGTTGTCHRREGEVGTAPRAATSQLRQTIIGKDFRNRIKTCHGDVEFWDVLQRLGRPLRQSETAHVNPLERESFNWEGTANVGAADCVIS